MIVVGGMCRGSKDGCQEDLRTIEQGDGSSVSDEPIPFFYWKEIKFSWLHNSFSRQLHLRGGMERESTVSDAHTDCAAGDDGHDRGGSDSVGENVVHCCTLSLCHLGKHCSRQGSALQKLVPASTQLKGRWVGRNIKLTKEIFHSIFSRVWTFLALRREIPIQRFTGVGGEPLLFTGVLAFSTDNLTLTCV